MSSEGAVVGATLVAIGLMGLAIGLGSGYVSLLFGFALFVGGFILSFALRRYTRLDPEGLASADVPPEDISTEPTWHLAMRILSILLLVALIYGAAQVLVPGTLAFVGGVITAQGVDELRVARWIRRWESERGVRLFAIAPTVLFYPRTAVPAVYQLASSES